VATTHCSPNTCWPLVPKIAGSNPAEAVRFFRAKKSSACLRSEGKLSRLSYITDLWHVKEPFIWSGTLQMTVNLIGHFLPIIPPFTNRSLSLGVEHLWRLRAKLQRRCTEDLQLIGLGATGWQPRDRDPNLRTEPITLLISLNTFGGHNTYFHT
jgi:hypothetical protein